MKCVFDVDRKEVKMTGILMSNGECLENYIQGLLNPKELQASGFSGFTHSNLGFQVVALVQIYITLCISDT